MSIRKFPTPAERSTVDPVDSNRGPILFVAWVFLILTLALAPGAARSQSPTVDDSAASANETGNAEAPANPLDLDLLLEDPIAIHEDFQSLRDRLGQLARDGRTPSDFEAAAEELAADGVYTTAIELLWFAEQMAADETVAAGYRDRMRTWTQAAMAAESVVDEGGQLYVAGRRPESIETFLRALEINPFSERAHFRLADAWRRIYQEEYGNDSSLPPLEIRVRVFRDAYEHYALALAIDPLFYDAYYGMSELRGLFPDNQEFLLRTQDLTQRALDFRGELLPVLRTIEDGKAVGGTYVQLGEAFEVLGAFEYAVFAYQCALQLEPKRTDIAARLEKLRDERFGTGSGDASGGA